jgi:predicted nuclease of restriction endonuclease-like (RecB) superfamily
MPTGISISAFNLSTSFPEMKGFLVRNLKYMRTFTEAYSETSFVQQVVAQIPWGHIVRLLDLVKSEDERLWYIEETIKNGWSRNVLVHQIELNLYKRQIKNEKTHNFKITLPLLNQIWPIRL